MAVRPSHISPPTGGVEQRLLAPYQRDSQLTFRAEGVNTAELARPVDSGGSQVDLRLPQATRVIISVAQLAPAGAPADRAVS